MSNHVINTDRQRMQEKVDKLVNKLNAYFELAYQHEQELAERRQQLEAQRVELRLQEQARNFAQPDLLKLPQAATTLDEYQFSAALAGVVSAVSIVSVSLTLIEDLKRAVAGQASNPAVVDQASNGIAKQQMVTGQ